MKKQHFQLLPIGICIIVIIIIVISYNILLQTNTLMFNKLVSNIRLLYGSLQSFYETTTNNKDNFETNNIMDIEIVVARYNEDLKWLSEEPFNHNPIIIYNKGDNNNFEKSPNIKNIISLPNVGREAHSYLYHIIENYDNLAECTIFLPGSADLENKYERSKKMVIETNKSKNSVISSMKVNNVKDEFYNFEIDNYGSSHQQNRQINKDDSMQKSDIRPFGKWYEKLFTDCQTSYVSWNSIFSISKEHILQHPKTYYESLLKEVDSHQNCETVHYFERAWEAVFYPLTGAKYIW